MPNIHSQFAWTCSLQTERLLLRRFTMDDLDNVVALGGDPEVMRYNSGGLPTRASRSRRTSCLRG